MIEKLETKLSEIRTQKEKTLASYNCLIGAEQIVLQLIDEMRESQEREEIEKDND